VGEGLDHQAVFCKYFNRIFLKQFPKNFTAFSIHAQQLGWPEFRGSLQDYINTKVIQRDLFTPDRTYKMAEGRLDEPLLQLADFISGCLGLIYRTSHSHENAVTLSDLLHDCTFVDFYPFEKSDFFLIIPAGDQEKNKLIARIAAESAREALSDGHKLSQEAQAVLHYLYMLCLLHNRMNIAVKGYITKSWK
jgi:hypothetical protein